MPMANETDVRGASAGGNSGRLAIAILAAVALVCEIARFITVGAYPAAGLPRFIGETTGGAAPSFILGLIVFSVVRSFRRRPGRPFAGLLSGMIVVLAVSYAQYRGELLHVG
jgi:peptidoglycan/LPS O-acetylase OafA/YrhL